MLKIGLSVVIIRLEMASSMGESKVEKVVNALAQFGLILVQTRGSPFFLHTFRIPPTTKFENYNNLFVSFTLNGKFFCFVP